MSPKLTRGSKIKNENKSATKRKLESYQDKPSKKVSSSLPKTKPIAKQKESHSSSTQANDGQKSAPTKSRKRVKNNHGNSQLIKAENTEEEMERGEKNNAVAKRSRRMVPTIAKNQVIPSTKNQVKKTREVVKNNESKCIVKKPNLAKTPKIDTQDSSSSESEWEEVAEEEEDSQDLDNYNPDIPKEGVEITLENSGMPKKRQRKKFDVMDYIRLEINRGKKDLQLIIHEVHLLCLLARGIYINKILNSDEPKAFSLSLLPNEITPLNSKFRVDSDYIKKIVNWFRMTFIIDSNFKSSTLDLTEIICTCLKHQKAPSAMEYNMMFVVIARTLNLKVRLCLSFYPISHKPKDLLKKEKLKDLDFSKENETQPTEIKKDLICNPSCSKSNSKIATEEKKGKKGKKSIIKKEQKEKPKRVIPKRLSKIKRQTFCKGVESDDSDEDFDITQTTERKRKSIKIQKGGNRKILSSESGGSSSELDTESSIECWAEVFSNMDNEWISVECSKNLYKPYDIENSAKQPVSYVISIDSQSGVKDVTKRYCPQWMTHTRKLRVVETWWFCTLEPFSPPATKQNQDEDSKMENALLKKPMPSTISEFKNHPLYALKRHLLKFQAIYPPDSPTVGFMRSEPVYARECVHSLHSRETWVKEARMVRLGEEPYKIVKARPKWDKLAGVMKTDLPLELFGRWQTEEYMPPIAWNGKVPRNEYGNVELFKPCMLPIGTVHLRNPGLNRVAKKLNIDCSPAVVGFDGHKGSIHPVFDGFVICEEFKDTILAAWEEEQENIRKRDEEKRNKRVYGNWRKLIKGLLIRERIRNKYAVD